MGRCSISEATLPYVWDWWHRARGACRIRDGPPLQDIPKEPWFLYLRLGNAYEVRLNGALLDSNGDLKTFDRDDYGQIPCLITIPVGLLRQDNLIQVRIRADHARRAGVASPWVGSHAEILPLYDAAYLQRVMGTRVVVIVSLLVGTIALALWWTQVNPTQPSGKQRIRCISMRRSQNIFEPARKWCAAGVAPLSRFWWDILFIEALGIWVASMLMFSALAVGWRGRFSVVRLQRALAALLIAGINVQSPHNGATGVADLVVCGPGRRRSAVCRAVLLVCAAQWQPSAPAGGCRPGFQPAGGRAGLGRVSCADDAGWQYADALFLGGFRRVAGLYRVHAASGGQRAGALPAVHHGPFRLPPRSRNCNQATSGWSCLRGSRSG